MKVYCVLNVMFMLAFLGSTSVSGFAQDVPCSAEALEFDISSVGNNSFASADGALASCFSDNSIDNDVWWSFVATSNGATVFTTDISMGNDDTQIAVYASSDNTCLGAFTQIGCNEDISASNWMSSLNVCGLTQGDTYFVQVDGWSGASGGFQIDLLNNPDCVFCDPSGCNAGEFLDTSNLIICPGDLAWFSIADFNLPSVDNCDALGAIVVIPLDANSQGGPANGEGFVWTNPDLSGGPEGIGSRSFQFGDPFSGQWQLIPTIFINGEFQESCDQASIALKIDFLSVDQSPCQLDTVCIAGSILNGDQVLCPGAVIDLSLSSEHDLPPLGDFNWFIQNGDQSISYQYNFRNDPEFYQFKGDINGLLAYNQLPILTAGPWRFQGAIIDMTDSSVCDVTDMVIISILEPVGNPCFMDDCSDFETAPVELNKSFNPVNGLQDRLQVKWFKASPQVKYTDSDAAMCDIQFSGVKNLDPITGLVTGNVNPIDTVMISDVKKTYGDGSPKGIFKWPLKYRAQGAGNSKRLDPNIRYRWRVRCECGHDGSGLESPWSEIKTFNTPDFDPTTGINSKSVWSSSYMLKSHQLSNRSGTSDQDIISMQSKTYALFSGNTHPDGGSPKVIDSPIIQLYPNPAGSVLNVAVSSSVDALHVLDMSGRMLIQETSKTARLQIDISTLSDGVYMIELDVDEETIRRPFIVKK